MSVQDSAHPDARSLVSRCTEEGILYDTDLSQTPILRDLGKFCTPCVSIKHVTKSLEAEISSRMQFV
jgi:hypothetical protein